MKYAGHVAGSRRWWLASVATVVVLVVAIWLIAVGDRDRHTTDQPGADPPSTAAAVAVEDYARFAAASAPQSGAEALYLAEGLRKLAGALATLNVGGPDLAIDLRVHAEHVLLNPSSVGTTALIRDDLIAAADALGADARAGPSLRPRAESIRTDRPLVEQHATVREFFRSGADVLQRLASGRP
jgi:hypothetical protein